VLLQVFKKDPDMRRIFDVISEPEYVHRWKAVWEDDKGEQHVNICWRVQQNSALGPYKGGLRFDPSVTLDTLRFLALEQVFKNALTGKAIGGGKGGSDFNPKGKSDNELRRFCEAFMLGLHRVIGPDMDVPAGDIGVGGKVIGYLYGFWRKLRGGHVGVLTGKGLDWGGSELRTEATGYGLVYLTIEHLNDKSMELSGQKVLISGSGNVATYAAKKCIQEGAIVLTLSDRNGTYFCDKGMTEDQVDGILAAKQKNGKVPKGITKIPGKNPWIAKKNVKADIVLPCATQNEIEEGDAQVLIERGVHSIVEGSNLSSTAEAVAVYRQNSKSLDYIGSKLANLGGVGTSYLEMVQNAYKSHWEPEQVDKELHDMMKKAYKLAKDAATEYGVSITDGANIAAFLKVAKVMKELGYVNSPL